MWLADEDKEGRIWGIHVEVGDDLQLVEVFYFKQMGLVEYNNRNLFVIYDIVSDTVLNRGKQLGFSVEGFPSQQYWKLPVEVYDIDRGKRRIDRLKEIGVELFDKGSDMQGFTCARGAGDKHDSSFMLHMLFCLAIPSYCPKSPLSVLIDHRSGVNNVYRCPDLPLSDDYLPQKYQTLSI